MKRAWIFFLPALLMVLVTTGCYTKFYRPGMDAQGPYGPQGQLYHRYDSTAIDTTLTAPEPLDRSEYDDDGWYSWGRYRPPRWGFDWWGYTPGYYWGYYGYNDYYGTPWWHNSYYDPWYWNHHGGYPVGPAEPPSQRQGRRDRQPSGGGAPVASPPPASGGGGMPTVSPPPPTQTNKPLPPPQKNPPSNTEQKDDGSKRSGKRGR